MYKTQSRTLEVLLILIVIGFASYNYFRHRSSSALPRNVMMYSTSRVLQYDKDLMSSTAEDSDIKLGIQNNKFYEELFDVTYDKTTPKADSKFNYHGMGRMQVIKYVVGCYPDLDFSVFEGKGSATLKSQYLDNLESHKTTTEAYVGDATKICTCIDSMYSSSLNAAGRLAAHRNKLSAAELLVYNEWFAATDANRPAIVTAFSTAEKETWEGIKHLDKDSLYGTGRSGTANYEYETALTALEQSEHAKDTIKFCSVSSSPVRTVSYEGGLSIPIIFFVAHLCIILSLLHSWDFYLNPISNIDHDDADNNRDLAGRTKQQLKDEYNSGHKLRRLIKGILGISIFVIYVVFGIMDIKIFSSVNEKQATYRSKEYTAKLWGGPQVFVFVAVLLVALIEILYEFLSSRAVKVNEKNVFGYSKNSTVSLLMDRIAVDVPFIFGFSLFSIGIMLQSDITSSASVIGGAFVILTAGFLQHISNLVKIMYQVLCARLSPDVIIALTLVSDEGSEDVNPAVLSSLDGKILDEATQDKFELTSGIRSVMQYFGWTRLFIFNTVLVLSFAFFTISKDTTRDYVLSNMLDGQLLYFTFAFIWANIGFDVFYELMPFMFENVSCDLLRLYFISAYLLFFNLTRLIYMHNMLFKGHLQPLAAAT